MNDARRASRSGHPIVVVPSSTVHHSSAEPCREATSYQLILSANWLIRARVTRATQTNGGYEDSASNPF